MSHICRLNPTIVLECMILDISTELTFVFIFTETIFRSLDAWFFWIFVNNSAPIPDVLKNNANNINLRYVLVFGNFSMF
jgi:hypothetical protein